MKIEEYHGDLRKDSEKYFQSLTMGERVVMMMDFADEYKKSGFVGCAARGNQELPTGGSISERKIFSGADSEKKCSEI